jgi:hypothetical protein
VSVCLSGQVGQECCLTPLSGRLVGNMLLVNGRLSISRHSCGPWLCGKCNDKGGKEGGAAAGQEM